MALFCVAIGIAVLGFSLHLRHKTNREVLLTADNRRAVIMADYYNHAGGAER